MSPLSSRGCHWSFQGPHWIPGLLLEQWWLSLKLSVNLRVKAIARHGAQSQGVIKNHNWNWEGYLGTIMLESYFAGGFLCPKLPFEPKVVKKVHPGAKRSILRSGGSSSKALPGALESVLGQKRLALKLLKLILEPWRITLKP